MPEFFTDKVQQVIDTITPKLAEKQDYMVLTYAEVLTLLEASEYYLDRVRAEID